MPDASEPEYPSTAEAKAARNVMLAMCAYGEALVRKKHKLRSHRKPIDTKIDADLAGLINPEWLESHYFDFIQKYQTHIDKSREAWTQTENLQAMGAAASFFLAMAVIIDPPKGRPLSVEKKYSTRIFDHMPALKPKTKNEDKIGAYVEKFLRIEEPFKIGVFARKERDLFVRGGMSMEDATNELGSLVSATAYISEMDEDEKIQIIENRMPPGALNRMFIQMGGDKRSYDAFKKRVSRARLKRRLS